MSKFQKKLTLEDHPMELRWRAFVPFLLSMGWEQQ